ncbi:phosphopyruvate hydratase [Leucobacter ruminantium]|uniref:Enolase n=1 Tax=Leucobacter ruminantium TaxID=1289170 RepID=A0A939RX79_9MICO|nr:enolase C-terminal domain-like protein [Leucobacter ruminantium]MBO1804398.1 phosphopyruvate hydratase [Leucobacter ruminantium]
MTVITSVAARQILDCKARPMVEVEIRTDAGAFGRAAAPTGSSVGIHEAKVLRDEDPSNYDGLSVHRAVSNVTDVIAPKLVGFEFETQRDLDDALLGLDGTVDKGVLGGNAIYPVSVAFLRAQAAEAGERVYEHIARGPLTTIPVPCFNVINGGRNRDAVQAFNEFIVVPAGAESIDEAVEMGVQIFKRLPGLIESATGNPATVGGSYGYAAPYGDPHSVLSLMQEAVAAAGYEGRVSFALDCASSEMYDRESKTYELNGGRVDSTALVGYLKQLTEEFDLLFVEDPLDEDDWEGFSLAVRELTRTYVLGDDLIVTNKQRLDRAIAERAAEGFVLKPNQIGTITESLDTFDTATENGMFALPSGRSGGVIDDIVMDLSLGLQVPFQKNGAPRSGERIEKLNFLMRAAQEIPGSSLSRIETLARY